MTSIETRIADVSLQIVRDCLPRLNAKEPDTAATQHMLVRNRQKFGSNLEKHSDHTLRYRHSFLQTT